MNDIISRLDGCYCHIRHSLPVPGCLCCRWVGSHRWATAERRIGGRAYVPAVHTEVLAGHDKTCRWMSAATWALSNRILVLQFSHLCITQYPSTTDTRWCQISCNYYWRCTSQQRKQSDIWPVDLWHSCTQNRPQNSQQTLW